MKLASLFVFCLLTTHLIAQTTFVPDDILEGYLETHNSSGVPVTIGNPTSMGNGISNDNYVLTSRINNVSTLQVNNLGINEMTGIESFTVLTSLNCSQNNLTSIDVSQNTLLQFFYCSNNNLSALNVSQNIGLKYLMCSGNNLTSLDLSSNINLTNLWCDENQISSLNISQNNLLLIFNCYANDLTSLDVSHCANLVELYCGSNQLICLNIATQTEYGMTLSAMNNPNLSCIEVFNINFPPPSWASFLDPQMYYSENCMNICSNSVSLSEITTTKKRLIQILDFMGRETTFKPNTPLIYRYDNGSVEKIISIE
jgi:hypothetical protein